MGIDHTPTSTAHGVHIDFHLDTHGDDTDTDGLDDRDDRFKHYDGHYKSLVEGLEDLHTNNTASDCIYAWKQGNNAPSSELDEMVAVAQTLSPSEIREAADEGLITQDEANAVIVLGGLQCAGYTGSDLQVAMKNYYALDEADQQQVLMTMSMRDVDHEVKENVKYGHMDKYSFTDTPGEMDNSAIRAAIFLTNAKPEQLGNMRQFVAFDYEDTDYDCVGQMNGIDDWNKLGDTEKHDLEKMVAALPDKTTEQAALEGYGTNYQVFMGATSMQYVKDGVGKHKHNIDTAIQELQAQIANGDDVDIPVDRDSMIQYLAKTDPGVLAEPPDVRDALADYALSLLVGTPSTVVDGTQPLTDDEARATLAGSIDGWDSYTPEQQDALVQYLMTSSDPDVSVNADGNYVKVVTDADGNVVTGADGQPETVVVGKPLTPDDMRGMGFSDKDVVDIGTLMFLVLMDRMQSQDDLIRGYTEDVDKKNQDLKNATAAQSALRACDASDNDVDITEVYFTNQNGEDVSVYDYCEAYGIEIPQDSNGNPKTQLNSTEMDNLLTSMKSYSDTLSTDAQSALQKLQQATDRYSNTNSLLTNFESAWRSMLKEIIQNIRA